MDAFLGYNQIRMVPEDEVNTSFIIDRGMYYYKVMPFGLKNAGITYQWLINKVFHDQIDQNMEVYIDDMLVKSIGFADHIIDLTETFDILRLYNMKLNLVKCGFSVSTKNFLGFMVQD